MTIFLLGPARDDKGGAAPLALRRSLVEELGRLRTRAVVMEDVSDLADETNLAKFQRIVHEEDVTTFALVVPLRSRLHGTSVELGHILTRIQDGCLDSQRVHLLLQASLARLDDDGVMALTEPGNRTRYYLDLIDEGCPIHRWMSERQLNWQIAAVAMDDRLRNANPSDATRF